MTRPTVLLAALAASLAASAARAQAPQRPRRRRIQYAVFETSRGKIGVKLLPQKAPKAVENFVQLAQGKKAWTDPATGQKVTQPLYDGTLFHRVIPGFMIQGGDPLSRGAPIGETSVGGPAVRDGRSRLPLRRRAREAAREAVREALPARDGEQRPQHERLAVLHHRGGDALARTRRRATRPAASCGYVHFGEGICGCELVAPIARAGNGQTKLVKVTITNKAPTCK